jgi:hypothetical protein
MARFDAPGLDALIRDMERMGQSGGQTAEAMVNAAVGVIRDEWRASAERHDLKDTGALIDSIGFPAPVQNAGGILYRDVYPQGVDGKGTRNAEKAFVLNYGTSKIPATYWVDEADQAAGPRVQQRLEEIWGEFLDTGKAPAITDPAGSTGTGVTKTITKG